MNRDVCGAQMGGRASTGIKDSSGSKGSNKRQSVEGVSPPSLLLAILLSAWLGSLLLPSMAAKAATIELNGTELLAGGTSGVSYPNGLPGAGSAANSALFGPSAAGNPVWLRWDILSANSYSYLEPPSTISFSANVTRSSEDFDFSVGLWDGSDDFVAIRPLADGKQPQSLVNSSSDGTVVNDNFDRVLTDSLDELAIGQSFDFELIWSIRGIAPLLPGLDPSYQISTTLTLGSFSSTVTSSLLSFDAAGPLSVLIAGQTPAGGNAVGETLQINRLSVQSTLLDAIVASVVEPSVLALMLGGLLLMICYRALYKDTLRAFYKD